MRCWWLVLVLASCRSAPPAKQTCGTCHRDQAVALARSHHGQAQARATTLPAGALENGMSIDADALRFGWRDADGGARHAPIRFTIGVAPVLQVVVETEEGHLQVPPLGLQTDGGWMLVPGLSGPAGEWTTPSFNWNGSCAPCHATGFQVRPEGERSTWGALTVDCVACHQAHTDGGDLGTRAHFEFIDGGAIAVATIPASPDLQSERCAACHARRRALLDDGSTEGAFFDRFEPGLIRAGLYRPNGLAEDEVYEVGSFLMSKMERAGVRCSDCHDPHSGHLRAEGNALCARCHQPSVFDSSAHHGPGALCTTCHMPSTTFIGVDVRRDHAFSIPDAGGLSDAFGAAFNQRTGACRALLAVVERSDVSSFQRASALALTADCWGPGVAEAVRHASASADDWVRYGAAVAGAGAPAAERWALLSPLLGDRRRAVRVQATRALVGLGPVPAATMAEAEAAERANTFRGDGFLNLGAFALAQGDLERAEREWREGLRRDPTFAPLTINLADLLRRTSRDDEGRQLLEAASREPSPWSSSVHYALGLAQWRAHDQRGARESFRVAALDGPVRHLVAWLMAIRALDGPGAAWAQFDRSLAAHHGAEELLRLGRAWAEADHLPTRARQLTRPE